MNGGFRTPLIVIFPRAPPNIPFSRCFFKKSLFFCPPSPVFLRVVISLRLPMVFNSSFMPGSFYKLYSHGLLAWPPTDPACLNSICLHPRHIQPARNGLNPAFSPLFFPPFCALLQSQGGSQGGGTGVGLGCSWCTPGFVWGALQELQPSKISIPTKSPRGELMHY